jgi:hypothetical protein
MQRGDYFGQRIDSEPQPQRACPAPQSRADLVELDVREVEVPKPTILEQQAVLASSRQPGGDGGVAMPEHPRRSCNI